MSEPSAASPDSSNPAAMRQDRLDSAALEFYQLVGKGQTPDIDEFVSRYPDLADDLRNLLANTTSLDPIPVPSRADFALPSSDGAAPLRLTGIEGVVSGRTIAFLKCGNFLVGRSSRAQFRIPSGSDGDLRVSHAHSLIELDSPLCRVHDLNSRNGTFVNGARIATSFLRDGDQLRIGRNILRVELLIPREVGTPEPPAMDADTIPLPDIEKRRILDPELDCPICMHPKRKQKDPLCARCQARAALVKQPAPGYRLVREVGRGDLGVVYLALNEKENRAVAVKVIDAANAPSPAHLARFLQDAEILKRLRHRYIVPFHDFGSHGKSLFIATEFIRGTDAVKLLMKHGALPIHIAVGIVCQLLSALKYAHGLGLVHRDIKPANVLIRVRPDRKTVKIADFGLARLYRHARVGGHMLPADIGGATAFMAPEQVLDCRGATKSADQYSAAATLYYLLTNACVYDQPKSVTAQFAQILNEDIVPIRDRRSALPLKLISIIHRALSREPERRFADVAEFKKALLSFGRLK